MLKNFNWRVYAAALSASLACFLSGISYAWSSPTLPKLSNLEENPFGRPITPFEESWLASILSIGAALGPFIGLLAVDKIGRKKTLLILALPMTISHFIIAFATNINWFYFSRIFLGLAIGCTYSIIPMYVGEIAEDSNRGAVGCFLTLNNNLGSLFCYIIGPYVSIRDFSLIGLAPIAVFVLSFGLFMPESPYYFLMVKKEAAAIEALKRLRPNYCEKELQVMKKNLQSSVSVSLRSSLKSKSIRKALVIGSGLVCFQQSSGYAVVVSYMQSIFSASGTTYLSAEMSSVLVGSIQVLTNLLTSQLVDRVGRRLLLLLSATGCLLAHALLGLYFYLQSEGFNVSHLSWLPVGSLILFVVLYMFGLGPVTWAIIGEIFPTHFKSYASTFIAFVCLFIAFVNTLFFPNLVQIIGMAFSFWIFALFCGIATVFVWFVVPETKGKGFLEVQALLETSGKK